MIYIYYGNNFLKIEEEVNNFVNSINENTEVINFDYSEDHLDDILIEISTDSFFFSDKIIIIKNPNLDNNDLMDNIINSKCNVVFKVYSSNINIQESNNIKLINVKDLNEIDVELYIKNKSLENNIIFPDNLIKYFINVNNNNFDYVVSELEKLILYVDNDGVVTEEIIDKIVFKDLEENIFELTNIILSNNKNNVYKIYNELLSKNKDTSMLFNILSNKFRELFRVKLFLEEGISDQEIIKILKISKGKLYYINKSLKYINLKTIKKFISDLLDYDYKIKTGKIDRKDALDLFILNV